jgi:outer membrane protein assembly factor BamB
LFSILAICGVVGLEARQALPPPLFPVRTVWTLALNNQLTRPPAYDPTHAFFSIAADRIVAYDLKSGAQQWIIAAQPQLAPVAGDGLLMVVAADLLIAVRSGDGSVAWQLPFDGKLAQPPVCQNGWLIVPAAGGTVHAFRASDGHLVWSRDVGSPAHAPPALAADRLYVPTSDGRIVAILLETGSPVWERRLGGAPNDVLALDERLYVGATDDFFYCLMIKDGRVDWRWRTGGDAVGVPVADDRRVYFVALDNLLRALDRTTGGQHWMRPLPFRPTTGPVKAGRTLVVTGQAPALLGYNMTDGSPAGEIPAAPDVAAPPHVFTDADTMTPSLVYITRDLTKGASATLITRSLEPPDSPIAPLPNLIAVTPTSASER